MTALLVGGDYVDPMKKALGAAGFDEVEHWDGRKVGDKRKELPRHAELVVVLTDYLSHGLLRSVRESASRRNVPVLYCRRSVNEVKERLQEYQRKAA